MRIFKYISIFAVIFAAVLVFRAYNTGLQSFEGKIFGTYYHIKARTELPHQELEQLIKNQLNQVNKQMSVFEPESEISRINRAPAGEQLRLSPEMSYLLENALKVFLESGGAFDPSVGKLVDLWGFGPDTFTKVPTDSEIKEVLSYTGFKKLGLSSDFTTLVKTDSRQNLNLSAIAKGYGVDQIADLLEKHGCQNYIVEIGGEIRLKGTKNDKGDHWTVGLSIPDTKHPGNVLALELTDYGLATSGNYRNFYVKDGQHYVHTISPQTGRPVEHNLASVTVFHPKSILADAYATALMEMGEEKGMQLARELELPVIMLVRTEPEQFRTVLSPAARKLIGE